LAGAGDGSSTAEWSQFTIPVGDEALETTAIVGGERSRTADRKVNTITQRGGGVQKRNINIFVLIDALGWRVVENRSFLSSELPYRMPLRTVLGFSSGAIPTILTGLLPAQNGQWNLFYYDPKESPFRWLKHFSWLPDFIMNHRVSSKVLKELGRRVLGLGPLFDCFVSPRLLPWFNWAEKRNLYGPRGIPGSTSIFDRLSTAGIPHRIYSYHDGSDQDILRRTCTDIETTDAKFFFVYLSEMDMFLHMHCDEPKKLDAPLAEYDTALRKVLAKAREIDPEASMTVISDHGMTPVRKRYDLVHDINSLGLRMPEDFLAVYDSTMARFWLFNDRARQQVTACLNRISCGRILEDRELRDLGILFPDRRYGEIIFLLEPGCLLAHSDFNGKGWNPLGMHGYHPDDPYSDAVYLSTRRPTHDLVSIADIYACMHEALIA
jgi:predicted AlkP superfamily pyrophosphatase or phosphodiesterase